MFVHVTSVYDSFSFASDPDQHICEIQLVHVGMFTARKQCNAHSAYAKFRSALELLETFGLAPGAAEDMHKDKDTPDAEEHREFVQELENDYTEFLARYRQTVGITSPAKGPAKMPQRAGASRSIPAGGAVITALSAGKGRRIAKRSPFD